jgi:hypothetical protein
MWDEYLSVHMPVETQLGLVALATTRGDEYKILSASHTRPFFQAR